MPCSDKPSQKAINELIEQRFSKIHDEVNGHATDSAPDPSRSTSFPGATSSPSKRRADDSDLSDATASPQPKKRKANPSAELDDAAFAARLQAEENNRARSTRGGVTKKKPRVKKQKKEKPARKLKENGEPESGTDAEPQRKGGFHVSQSDDHMDTRHVLTSSETHGALAAAGRVAGRISAIQAADREEDMGVCQDPRSAGP